MTVPTIATEVGFVMYDSVRVNRMGYTARGEYYGAPIVRGARVPSVLRWQGYAPNGDFLRGEARAWDGGVRAALSESVSHSLEMWVWRMQMYYCATEKSDPPEAWYPTLGYSYILPDPPIHPIAPAHLPCALRRRLARKS